MAANMAANIEEKYYQVLDLFFTKENVKEKATYKTLVGKMTEFDKYITEWNNNDLDEFIKSLGSISVNSINKYLQFTRNFYRFVCEEEKVVPISLELTQDLKQYIDMNRLLELTLTRKKYNMLRHLIIEDIGDIQYNHRDRVILSLAWEGLTNDEIKNLRKDHCIKYNEFGITKMRLVLKDRNVIIEDQNVIEDIEKTINQHQYYVRDWEGKNRGDKLRELKDTPYLIRGMITRTGKSETVANPSEVLKRVLRRLDGDIPGINLSELTIEDINRSRKIDYLKDDNISTKDIQTIFNKKTDCDIYWQEEVANLIKRHEK